MFIWKYFETLYASTGFVQLLQTSESGWSMFNNWLMWGSSASRLAKRLCRCDDGNLSSSKETLIQLSRPSKHSEFYFKKYTLSNGDVVLPY